jgi:hypothetical protein
MNEYQQVIKAHNLLKKREKTVILFENASFYNKQKYLRKGNKNA